MPPLPLIIFSLQVFILIIPIILLPIQVPMFNQAHTFKQSMKASDGMGVRVFIINCHKKGNGEAGQDKRDEKKRHLYSSVIICIFDGLYWCSLIWWLVKILRVLYWWRLTWV